MERRKRRSRVREKERVQGSGVVAPGGQEESYLSRLEGRSARTSADVGRFEGLVYLRSPADSFFLCESVHRFSNSYSVDNSKLFYFKIPVFTCLFYLSLFWSEVSYSF